MVDLVEYGKNYIVCTKCVGCPAPEYERDCTSKSSFEIMTDIMKRILELKQKEADNVGVIENQEKEIKVLKEALTSKSGVGTGGTVGLKLSHIELPSIVLLYIYLNGECIPPNGIFPEEVIMEAERRTDLQEKFKNAEYLGGGVIVIDNDIIMTIKRATD